MEPILSVVRISALRGANAISAHIIRAGPFLERVLASADTVNIYYEDARAERPIALRMILRDPHGLGTAESAAHTASIATFDISISVATFGVPPVGARSDSETYDGDH